MRHPDEVAAMLRLHGLGWGTRRIAAELGCDRETVQRYVAAGGWAAYRGPGRPGVLAGHEVWIEPPRVSRRQFGVCYAAIGVSASAA